MKSIYFSVLVFFTVQCSIYAQSITVNDGGCYFGNELTFSMSGGGSPARNIYIGEDQGNPLRVIWQTGKWRLQFDDGVNGWTDVYTSDFASSPNPPDAATGGWTDVFGCGGGGLDIQGTGTQSILPVELVMFDAKVSKFIELYWQTASETNNAGFDIERSADGVRFEKIGFVAGSGTTQQQQDYSFTDASRGGISYYRLKQLDFDGAFEHSKIIAVAQEDKSNVHISPNPSHGLFSITGIDAVGAETFTVMNNMGQVLPASIQRDGQLDMSAFPSGVYYLRVASSGQVVKLVKS